MTAAADGQEREALERATRLAARCVAAPAAALAVRDGARRHVLAAGVGLADAWRPGARVEDALPEAAADAVATLALADLRAEPRLREGALVVAAGAVACLAAPLRDAAGAPLGALCAFDRRPRAWSEQERATLADLAALAGLARARALEARERRALRHVAVAVAHGEEPAGLLPRVAAEAAQAFGAEAGAVVRYEDERTARVLGTWAQAGVVPLPPDAGLALDGGGIAAALRGGRPARRDGGPGHRPFRHRVGAPVVRDGRVWGFVAVLARDAPFPAGVEQRLADFAELVVAALAGSETRSQLAARATSDPLTGLANQRAFQERLAGEAQRARRRGRNLGLALIDLDGFKPVNDTYGHQVGDDVLVAVAARAAGTVRAGELLARVGGDELALLLPEADVEEACAVAERIRQLVAHEPFAGAGRVTVSAGVSDLALGGDADGLTRTADDALYWAKAQGRDVVAQYAPELVGQLGSEQRAERYARRQAVLGIGALARTVDAKVSERHSERVAELAVRLARAAGWPSQRLALLREAALVHDVGKVGVPDEVLARGPRGPREAALLREHAALGAEIAAEALAPEQVAWIRGHHERPDGGGYPDGLAGDAIPPGARLIAVADAWDAMTRPGGGRSGLGAADALAECRAGAGTQFAAEAVAALERVLAGGELAPALAARPALSLGA